MQSLYLKDLLYVCGADFGNSSWVTIDQAMVDSFAALAGDTQWIHTDPERAKDSIFGGTIVHGYLILAHAPKLMDELVTIKDTTMGINRGLNRLRFLMPLKVGDRVRLKLKLEDAKESKEYVDTTWVLKFEAEDYPKEVCVAHLVKRWIKDPSVQHPDTEVEDEDDGEERFTMGEPVPESKPDGPTE